MPRENITASSVGEKNLLPVSLLWKLCILSGILLGQGTTEYSFNFVDPMYSGYHSGDIFTELTLLGLVWVALAAVDIPSGIVDALLWGHSCVGMNGSISPLAVPLGALCFVRLCKSKAEGGFSYPTIFLLLALAFVFCLTDIWLSIGVYRLLGVQWSSIGAGTITAVMYFTRESPELLDAVTQCSKIFRVFEIDRSEVTQLSPSPESLSPLSATCTPSSGFGALADPTSRLWKYIDKCGIIQGPFGTSTMRMWNAEGYLKDDLLVSEWESVDFRSFSELRHTFS